LFIFFLEISYGAGWAQGTGSIDPTGQVILVVDVQRVLAEAQAAVQLREEIAAREQRLQEAFRSEDLEFARRDQMLTEERSELSPEEFQRRRQSFAIDVARLQSERQEAREALNQRLREGMQSVQLALFRVVREVAQERGASLVMAKNSVVLVHADYEITDSVIRRLDLVVPTVVLEDFDDVLENSETIGQE